MRSVFRFAFIGSSEVWENSATLPVLWRLSTSTKELPKEAPKVLNDRSIVFPISVDMCAASKLLWKTLSSFAFAPSRSLSLSSFFLFFCVTRRQMFSKEENIGRDKQTANRNSQQLPMLRLIQTSCVFRMQLWQTVVFPQVENAACLNDPFKTLWGIFWFPKN